MSPQEREAPAAPQSEGQEPIWETLKKLGSDVRWSGASHGAVDLHATGQKIEALADQVRADLVREWHRGHEVGISEERERIRHMLERRRDDLCDEQTRWSISKADFTQRAHEAAEQEAEVRAKVESIEAALDALEGSK